jgi:hypothetical protein
MVKKSPSPDHGHLATELLPWVAHTKARRGQRGRKVTNKPNCGPSVADCTTWNACVVADPGFVQSKSGFIRQKGSVKWTCNRPRDSAIN